MDSLPGTIAQQIREDRRAEPACGFLPVQFVDVLPRTTDQKVDLFPEALDAEAPDGLYSFLPDPGTDQYPLRSSHQASDRTILSTLATASSTNELIMNPSEET